MQDKIIQLEKAKYKLSAAISRSAHDQPKISQRARDGQDQIEDDGGQHTVNSKNAK